MNAPAPELLDLARALARAAAARDAAALAARARATHNPDSRLPSAA